MDKCLDPVPCLMITANDPHQHRELSRIHFWCFLCLVLTLQSVGSGEYRSFISYCYVYSTARLQFIARWKYLNFVDFNTKCCDQRRIAAVFFHNQSMLAHSSIEQVTSRFFPRKYFGSGRLKFKKVTCET